MRQLHHFSLSTTPTQIFNDLGKPLGNATSFFYETKDAQLFLITNWHVVTGRNSWNPSESKTGAVPSVVKITVQKKQMPVDGQKNIVLSDIDEISLPINSEDGNDPRWLEHPDYGFEVDVVGIKINKHSEFRNQYELNVVNSWKEFHQGYQPEVMDDVFVIGYPWGLSVNPERGGVIPIYKRGSIASDPIIDYRRRPCVLIDCRTTEAMSGSPVIASHSGLLMPDGHVSANTTFGTVSSFLGIYSGRLIKENSMDDMKKEISEIGVVWKASVLDAITQNGIPGTPLKKLAS